MGGGGFTCWMAESVTEARVNMLIFGYCKKCLDPYPCVWDTYKNKIYSECFICLPLAKRDWPVPSFLDFTAIIKKFHDPDNMILLAYETI